MLDIVYGEDSSLIKLKTDELIKKENLETEPIYFDARKDLEDDFFYEADSNTLFDGSKCIVVDNASFLSGKNTTAWNPESVLLRADSDHHLIFIVHSSSLDKRKKIVKEFLKRGRITLCEPLSAKTLPNYLKKAVKEAGLTIDEKTFKYIQQRIGTDPLKIKNELERISIFSSSPGFNDVKALLSIEPLDDVFKMVDALFAQNSLLLLAYYRNFRKQNMEPMAILAILFSQVRFLFQVKACMESNMNKEQIASYLKAHPYRVQVNMQKASAYSASMLLERLLVLADLDENMKLGFVDKDLGFENFILSFLR